MAAAPGELLDFLRATDEVERERAWAHLVDRISPLLLHTARSVARDRDRAMDAYTHLLVQFRAEEGRRLRGYTARPDAQFTTWLVVVARRLCVDHLRARYGRLEAPSASGDSALLTRRRLADLIASELDDSAPLPDPAEPADLLLARRELLGVLETALTALAPSDRLILALRFEDDLPAREIARILKFPTPFHAYRRINGLLAQLRQQLSARGFDRPHP